MLAGGSPLEPGHPSLCPQDHELSGQSRKPRHLAVALVECRNRATAEMQLVHCRPAVGDGVLDALAGAVGSRSQVFGCQTLRRGLFADCKSYRCCGHSSWTEKLGSRMI